MNILVAGASGILGSAIVRECAGRHPVRALTREDLDITDSGAVRRALSGGAEDIVVNCAAYTDVDGCETHREEAFAVNDAGADILAAACRENGRTLVHVSTDYVFDGEKGTPYTENDVPRPLSVYGESKLAGEKSVARALPGTQYLLVRSQWIYGAGGRNFVDTISEKAARGAAISVVNDQYGSPTWARDLARAILRLLERNARGVYHVANAGIITWWDCAKKIVDIRGYSCAVHPQPSSSLNRPARRPGYAGLDCGKYRATAGEGLRTWDSALEEYLGSRP